MSRKREREKLNLKVIKIKRAAVFALGLAFFLFPGQNFYSSLGSKPQPPATRQAEALVSLADYPVKIGHQEPPFLTARSVVVMDDNSAVLLFHQNEKTRLLPASTVKIMTALVTLDFYQLDEILTVGQANDEGQDMGLVPGERISVKNLLFGLLVSSANDAAWLLAENYPGGKEAFVQAMNQKAQGLNLNDTRFANPTGLDSDRSGHLLPDYPYTTALDLARLASFALKNETLARIVEIQETKVTDESGKISHQLYNVNQLLGHFPGVKGIKTGWTEEAGECLVSLIERQGQGVIIVILGSQDRFGETAQLAEWAFGNYQWQRLIPSIQEK